MTKAEILTFVNEQLKRSETAVDTQIKTVLNELNRHELLTETAAGTIDQSDNSFTKPTDYKSYVSLTLTGSNSTGEPLLPMPGGYKGLLEARGNRTEVVAEVGVPGWYADLKGGPDMEIYPAADQDYTYALDYYKRHANSADTIEYGDEWANVFNFGATYYTSVKYSLTGKIAIWQPIYIAERQAMILATPRQIRVAGG